MKSLSCALRGLPRSRIEIIDVEQEIKRLRMSREPKHCDYILIIRMSAKRAFILIENTARVKMDDVQDKIKYCENYIYERAGFRKGTDVLVKIIRKSGGVGPMEYKIARKKENMDNADM